MKHALLGGLLALVALSACGDARNAEDDPSPASQARAGQAGDPAAEAPACGWIPEDAREATAVASIRAASAGDPLCRGTGSALDVPKAVAASFEGELRDATRMSDAEESRIGARLEAALPRERSFAGRFDLPRDVHRYGGYLRDIVRNLARSTTRPGIRWRIHLVHVPAFNAAALPGGTIVVFTGTLEGRDAVHDEAELAAVLGHEMAHVERRDVVAAYQFARAALGDETDEAVLAMRILTQPLSSVYELAADERGMELATLAQYDPQGAVNLWKRHARSEPRPPQGREVGGILGEVLQGVDTLLQSHPPPAVRACRAMDKLSWAVEHAPCPLVYDGRSNLRAHVAGPRRAF